MASVAHSTTAVEAQNKATTIYWAGILLALGSAGVVVTSILYALAPLPVTLPLPNSSFADMLREAISAKDLLIEAGTFGVFSDILLTVTALVMLVTPRQPQQRFERFAWASLAVSIFAFFVVDSFSASVLSQVAAQDGALAAFTGFKSIFNIAFVIGTLAGWGGGLLLLSGEMNAESPLLPKPLLWIGIVAGIVGIVTALLYFANISIGPLIGLSILGFGGVFTLYGIQVARTARAQSQ